jgi:DNA-directed RNA polymerase subunit E'/Rpb7
VSFIIVVYDVKNIYAYNVTQRDGFRQVSTKYLFVVIKPRYKNLV